MYWENIITEETTRFRTFELIKLQILFTISSCVQHVPLFVHIHFIFSINQLYATRVFTFPFGLFYYKLNLHVCLQTII